MCRLHVCVTQQLSLDGTVGAASAEAPSAGAAIATDRSAWICLDVRLCVSWSYGPARAGDDDR